MVFVFSLLDIALLAFFKCELGPCAGVVAISDIGIQPLEAVAKIRMTLIKPLTALKGFWLQYRNNRMNKMNRRSSA